MMKNKNLLKINIEDICIPPENCFTVKPGLIDSSIITEMNKENYDYAPVVEDKCVYGLVSKKFLMELNNNNLVLSPKDIEISNESNFFEINHLCISLYDVLERMNQSMAVLVFQTGHTEKHRFISNFIGLTTIADLNRNEIRTALYLLIATLESNLAKFIEEYFSDPNDWLKKLNEDNQCRILGYHALSKRNNVEINFIEATQLTDLLNIAKRTKEIIKILKFKSGEDFEEQTDGISNLRNQVMHITSLLIKKQSDISKLLKTIRHIDDFIVRLKENMGSRTDIEHNI